MMIATPHTTTDVQECYAALALLTQPGELFEIRVLPMGGHKLFRADPEGLQAGAEFAARWSDDPAVKGVYLTMNPVGREPAKAAKDEDIARRCWLLVDVDPMRPANTNATDVEIEQATRVFASVETALAGLGMADHFVAHSGNGRHGLYPIDLPNDTASRDLIKDLLISLDRNFGTLHATIDTTVYNASRIVKLYGTIARRGPHSEDRPHRKATFSSEFRTITPYSVETLRTVRDALETTVRTEPPPKAPRGTQANGRPSGGVIPTMAVQTP